MQKVLVYAPGGGWGHVVRAYKIYQKFVSSGENFDFHLVTSPKILPNLPNTLHVHFLENDFSNLLDFVQQIQPTVWITDVFPDGIQGELTGVLPTLNCQKILTMRILKESICRIFPENTYDVIWQVEWLPNYMQYFLKQCAPKVKQACLQPLFQPFLTLKNRSFILHTGNENEISTMKSRFPDYEVVNPFDFFPLPKFENCRIVTAAGCNIFQDLQMTDCEWNVIPQKRYFDDQFLRLTHQKEVFAWFKS